MKNSDFSKKDILATDLILRQVAPLPVQPIGPETGLFKGFFQTGSWNKELGPPVL